jgi:predicted PurR-regulated permease PerM
VNDLVINRPGVAPPPGASLPSEPPIAAASDEAARARLAPSWAAIGIFLLLMVAGLAHARDFLMPVVLAFLLALVFSPVRRFLDRRRVPSWLSALVIVGALFAVIVAGILALSGPVADWINRAPSIFADLQIKMRGIAATMAEVTDKVDSIAKSPAAPEVPEVVVKQPGITASLAGLAPVFIAQIGFVLVLLLFLLSSGDMIYEKIAVRIARDIEQKLSTYLFTITVINTGLGIAVGVTMWAIGMPNPLLFGVAAFAFNYIPYVGAVTGVVLATIVGLISGDELWLGAVAGGSYLLLTTIEGQLITPYFVGRRLRLNTVVVFLSIALWAWLWSVVGMIVATPLLVAVRTFCEYIPSLENVGAFLSARGDEQEDTDAPSPT